MNTEMERVCEYNHYCKALKRGFATGEEWCDYVRTMNGTDVVAEYNGFQYNIYDVCLNPHVKNLHISGMDKCTIYTAESEGGWSYGYDFSVYNSSTSGCPCYKLSGEKGSYITERAALEAAIRIVGINYCQRNDLDSAINELKSEIMNIRQLTLF